MMIRILLALALFLAAHLHAEKPPNILLILADDLGIECLSSYGGLSHQTPNLDRLASKGMQFSHCFSNPTCSPSRATLLTGGYSFQHGVKRVIWHHEQHANLYLRTDQPSFARQLKAAGYTTAIAGKWQLSFLDQRNIISEFGFDQYQCWQIYDAKGGKTRRFHQPHFNRNGEIVEGIDSRYGPDVNVEFLMEFMKSSQDKGQPFLAYYTSLLPHYPWVPTPDSEDQNYALEDNTGKGDPKYFPDMVRYLDKCVGRLLNFLEAEGMAENTIVFFIADNGTDQDLVNRWGQGIDVKGGKGTMTDLGTRVPLIVRWPGQVKAGSHCSDLIDFTDLFPTLCEIAGAKFPLVPIHGRSFLPQLTDHSGEPREWVHLQNYNNRYLRSRYYFYDPEGDLRPVVELGREEPFPDRPPESEARDRLKADYDSLSE